MVINKSTLTAFFILFTITCQAQIIPDSTIKVVNTDSVLRIRNINPYITLHVDSTLRYDFEINIEQGPY